ncbi:MAG: glucokinase [Chlamydiales bacterium]
MTKSLWTIGIDLGATKAGIAQVDSFGKLHHKVIVPTAHKESPEAVIKDMVEAIKSLCQDIQDQPIGIGIGIAGQVDPEKNLVHYAPNLEWKEFPIGAHLTKHLHIPVTITNDVRAAARGEWEYGAGKGSQNLVCVFVGTGVGGGIVSNEQMIHGHSFTAGEIGHMTIDFNGPKCACGNIGCLEAYAGGNSIAKRAKEAIKNNPEKGKGILNHVEGQIDQVTAKTVSKAYHEKDPLAREIIQDTIKALTFASINIVNVLNPQHLIFGGGVVEGIPEMLESIKEGIQQHALKTAARELKVLEGQLKSNAGIIGAASLALKTFGPES